MRKTMFAALAVLSLTATSALATPAGDQTTAGPPKDAQPGSSLYAGRYELTGQAGIPSGASTRQDVGTTPGDMIWNPRHQFAPSDGGG